MTNIIIIGPNPLLDIAAAVAMIESEKLTALLIVVVKKEQPEQPWQEFHPPLQIGLPIIENPKEKRKSERRRQTRWWHRHDERTERLIQRGSEKVYAKRGGKINRILAAGRKKFFSRHETVCPSEWTTDSTELDNTSPVSETVEFVQQENPRLFVSLAELVRVIPTSPLQKAALA